MPAVGKLLTHAAAGVGAVATQARINPYLGIDGVTLLREGFEAREVIERLKTTDPCMSQRQVAAIDNREGVACWTGDRCLPWSGSISGEGFCVQGNRLTGRDVLEAVVDALNCTRCLPLVERLMEALAAGDSLGGDRHGESSATIYIVDREEYPLWDIRVDHRRQPLTELRRQHGVFEREVLPEILGMPTRDNPAGAADEDPI